MAGRPSSKGKVETQMKLLDEIYAYQGKLTLEELNEKIQQINLRKNMDIHSGTGKSSITVRVSYICDKKENKKREPMLY